MEIEMMKQMKIEKRMIKRIISLKLRFNYRNLGIKQKRERWRREREEDKSKEKKRKVKKRCKKGIKLTISSITSR